MVNKANSENLVDLIVSSTDKNFMVPVGGAIVYSNNCELVEKLNKSYPGRASANTVMDLFITFLSIGRDKLVELI